MKPAPKVGDQVAYHPRPSDRVRKPDSYGGLVTHAAFVAHVHADGSYNLMAIDSGGVPYSVTNIQFLVSPNPAPEFGGWCEHWPDGVPVEAAPKDPFIKDNAK